MADLLTILGPTASGKTSVAVSIASRCNAEIISADSRQVYRRMDIGTGKDLEEYQHAGRTIPYHLIDICEPGMRYDVFQYQRDFLRAYEALRSRHANAILCGGTGLYIESVLRGYHLMPVPQDYALREKLKDKTLAELTSILQGYKTLHNTTDVDTARRAIRAIEIAEYYRTHPTPENHFPCLTHYIIGIAIEREERRRRITERLESRLQAGMIDEVRALLDEGLSPEQLIYYGLEYKYLTLYVIGKMSYDEMFKRLEIAIHQFAKRQMTWFRGMERRGLCIHWMSASEAADFVPNFSTAL